MASPKRARQLTIRSWTSGGMPISPTSSKTSRVTVSRPTRVEPARLPSMTWSERSRVKTSASKRGEVVTSASRSSTLSSAPGSVRALARLRISSRKRKRSS